MFNFSCKLQSSLLINAMEEALDSFEELVALYEKLQPSHCSNLTQFLNSTVKHWLNVLKEKVNE